MSRPPAPGPISFRAGVPADGPALHALVQSAYRGDASRVGWTTEADLLDGQRTDEAALQDLLAAEDGVVLVAETDDPGPASESGPAPGPGSGTGGSRVLVACCHVEHEGGGVAHLGLFAVRPALQGGGIGRAVVAEAERVARHAWGATEMRMHVIRQRDDLLAWYERLGYRPTGSFEPFPYGDERFGIPRRPDLEFTVIAKRLEPGVGG